MATHVYKKIAKTKKIVTKNKYGNQDSTNNSLAHPVEMHDNETLQLIQAITAEDKQKKQTKLTFAVSQAEHI